MTIKTSWGRTYNSKRIVEWLVRLMTTSRYYSGNIVYFISCIAQFAKTSCNAFSLIGFMNQLIRSDYCLEAFLIGFFWVQVCGNSLTSLPGNAQNYAK
jgi:hypothetical protein